MGISKRAKAPEPDRVVDNRIREALYDDSPATVPPGAWDRLRKAIMDRRVVRSRGMWLLDEPFRDPPETLPTTLDERQLKRAMRLYCGVRHEDYFGYQIKEMVWTHLLPTFSAVVNL